MWSPSISRHPSVSSTRVGCQAGTELAMTDTTSRSRRTNCARFASNLCLLKHQRAWGTPGAPMRRSLACEVVARTCTRVFTAVAPEITRHPRTQWFYGLIRDLPGEPCTFATVVRGFKVLSNPVEPNEPPQDLTPAWGRQDHTISPYAHSAVILRAGIAHGEQSAPRPIATPDAAASTASPSQRS